MHSQSESPRNRNREDDTERRILDAARAVFVRRGTAGARMQEIAAEAGVNQALLHYYFRSKDRLAATVFKEVAAQLVPAVVQLLGSDAPLEQKVERFVHLYIDTVRRNPFLPAYLIGELHQQPERLAAMVESAGANPRQVAQGLFQRLGAQLRAEAAAGKIRPIAPEQLLINLIALSVMPFIAQPLLHTVLGMSEAAFGRFLDERRAELPGFILNGLRP
jgi:AcrR family transcriptional regulator